MPQRTFFFTSLLMIFGAIFYFGIDLYSENDTPDAPHIYESKTKIKFDGGESGVGEELLLKIEVTNKESEEALDQKRVGLLELEESIGLENEKLGTLIEQYDQNLADEGAKEKLSSALLNSDEYRASLLEKFKIENELKNTN